jgi:hypothetical protein
MVKWTGKWLRYAKIPKFLVKGHKVVPKCFLNCLLNWFFKVHVLYKDVILAN